MQVRGQAAELICEFDSERSPLYSVKWFKDDEEFFRYVPAARQQYQVFSSDGLTVDNDSSSASRVVLRKLDFAASGSYRCEVSTEGPEFSTVIGQGNLLVVEPLSSDPNLTGGKRKYDINDTVDLMCTSSPSRPAAHLTWVINGHSPPKEQVMDVGLHQQPDGLLVRSSRISFRATPSHFVSGRLVLKCVASLSKPLNIIKNTENRDTNSDDMPNRMLAHFFNKWENTIEVSASSSLSSERHNYILVSLIILYMAVSSFTSFKHSRS
ncbi:hypothetical protein Avbf_03850 [Armadillidium vulgare]|nr:hypothetical protein Avbf_03850 [Armadillidium vulgare]